jgi:integrase
LRLVCVLIKGFDMAKVSVTSITEFQSLEHTRKGIFRTEMACTKIPGFHLQKMATCSTWRYRYRNFNNKQKIIKLDKFVDGNSDRLKAAYQAKKYQQLVAEGFDPVAIKEQKQEAYRQSEAKSQNGVFGKYLEGIYTDHQSRKVHKGKHTIDMIRKHFQQWLELPMDSITVVDLKHWQSEKRKSQLSHATIKRAFGALRTMLRHSVREGVLEFDPTHKFQLDPPAASEKNTGLQGHDLKTRRMLTGEELAGIHLGIERYKSEFVRQRENSLAHGKKGLTSLKDLAHPHWFFPFFRLAAYSGLRTGDLYTLNWQELNIQFKRLVKVPNKTKHHHDPIKLNLPLDDDITHVLGLWYKQCGKPANGLVFPSPVTGKQMDKKAHVRHWKKILKLGQIKTDLDFYSLRHHYISRLVAGNIPLFTVARLAGHKSTKMTEQHYGHLAPNAAIEALALIAGDFSLINTLAEEKSN